MSNTLPLTITGHAHHYLVGVQRGHIEMKKEKKEQDFIDKLESVDFDNRNERGKKQD